MLLIVKKEMRKMEKDVKKECCGDITLMEIALKWVMSKMEEVISLKHNTQNKKWTYVSNLSIMSGRIKN